MPRPTLFRPRRYDFQTCLVRSSLSSPPLPSPIRVAQHGGHDDLPTDRPTDSDRTRTLNVRVASVVV